MIVKLLTENHLEFLSLKEGCRGSFESTLVKMSNCWKSHAAAQMLKFSVCTVRIYYNVNQLAHSVSGKQGVYLFLTSNKEYKHSL